MNWKRYAGCTVRHPCFKTEDDMFRYECCFKGKWFVNIQSKKYRAFFTTVNLDIKLDSHKKAISWCESFDYKEHEFKGVESNKLNQL